MSLNELRDDCAKKQKKGLHFILASVLIWCAVLAVHLTGLPVLTGCTEWDCRSCRHGAAR